MESAAFDFAQTEEFLQAAEGLVGPYEWGRYDVLCLPPSFPYGGMENPCLTFVTPTLLVRCAHHVAFVIICPRTPCHVEVSSRECRIKNMAFHRFFLRPRAGSEQERHDDTRCANQCVSVCLCVCWFRVLKRTSSFLLRQPLNRIVWYEAFLFLHGLFQHVW